MLKLYLFLFCVISYAHCIDVVENESEFFNGPSGRGIRHWSKRDRVIFDCDGSVADATALLMLLRAEERNCGPPVHAVTLVRRDVGVRTVAKNIGRILEVAGRKEIPFYIGADRSLSFTPDIDVFPYGNDALGDVPYDATGLPRPQDEVAAHALIRMVNELKGHAVIITCGSLTNIALALRLDEKFLSKVKTIIIGAGAVAGKGTIRALPGIEYKAWRDAEALKAVLSSTHYKSATLFPNDPVFDANAEIPEKFWINAFYTIQDPFVQFIKAVSQVYWNNGAPQGYALYDPMVVASYLWPHIIEECEPHNVTVSTNCECRGALFGGVTDFSNWRSGPQGSNVYVILKIDPEAYVDELLKLFGPEDK